MTTKNKLRNVLEVYQNGKCKTDEAIDMIARILDVKVEPDVPNIKFGTVFTGIFGKCIALGKPDKQGHFFAYSSKGYREVYHVSTVQEVHSTLTEQMKRVLVDIRDSDMWYKKAIPDEFRDPDEYTNPADLYNL